MRPSCWWAAERLVYRPKHEAADLDEDDYDYDEADPYGDMETEDETEDEA